jgi:hypothetical protein
MGRRASTRGTVSGKSLARSSGVRPELDIGTGHRGREERRRAARLLSARRTCATPAARYLGIMRTFVPGSILRSREQPASVLRDDDAELLVILGVEVDAVVVA